MRNFLIPFLLTSIWILSPDAVVLAENTEQVDTQVIMERANTLKGILDRLLVDSNHSSIQKVIKEGGESSEPLITEALRLKSAGEQLLLDEEYLQAAVALQSALDHIFQAIRSEEHEYGAADAMNARLAESITVNNTFIEAALRVVTGVEKWRIRRQRTCWQELKRHAKQLTSRAAKVTWKQLLRVWNNQPTWHSRLSGQSETVWSLKEGSKLRHDLREHGPFPEGAQSL